MTRTTGRRTVGRLARVLALLRIGEQGAEEEWSEPWRAFNLSNVPGVQRLRLVSQNRAKEEAFAAPGTTDQVKA
jgi:hypothetical protein